MCYKLAYKLGLSKKWCFTEIYGLEEELLEMLPKPAISLILLFPNKDDDDNEKLKTIYKFAANIEEENSSKVFFLRQVETLGYACGTIAMIHSIGNNQERSIVEKNSILEHFFKECSAINSYSDRGSFLSSYEQIRRVHDEIALLGRNNDNKKIKEEGEGEEEVDYHFISFVQKDAMLIELDGCKSFPVNHGNTSEENFLRDAIKVIRKHYFETLGVIQFALMALTPKQEDN